MKCLLLVLIVCYCSPTLGAGCHGSPSEGVPNLNAIYTDKPVKIAEYINHTTTGRGVLYKAGSEDDWFYICHVWGSPYDVGYAAGILMTKDVRQLVPAVWQYMKEQIEQGLGPKLPKWFEDLIAQYGLELALDVTFDFAKHWIGDYFLEEMHGMSDATGISFKEALRIHMIGGLTQGDCSMYGAWGDALKHVPGVELMQMRALDWDIDGPFKNHPSVTVYHNGPKTKGSLGKPFMNIGWTGWIGLITGMSEAKLAISQIGVYFPGTDFGMKSRIGYPFVFLLRDTLQFEDTLQGGLKRIGDATRTCDLLFGLGDGKESEFRGMAVSYSVFNVYDSKNLEPLLNGSHPRINDIVYWGMDWECPTYNKVLSEQLLKYYGNITAENTIRNILPIEKSGNLHIAIYDLTNMKLWIANARRSSITSGGPNAYQRQYTYLDVTSIFQEPMPEA